MADHTIPTPGTPLPWAADEMDLCQHRGGNLLVIATMTAGFHYEDKARQDAAYAATACNLFPELVETLKDACASLTAAVSLLERGGQAAKKAAPSDKMFDVMLADYRASLERTRAVLAKAGA